MEIFVAKNIQGLFITMDIEKAFDYLDHAFIINVLKKFGFREEFIA